mgnify:CR=1
MLDTLIISKLIIVILNTEQEIIFTNIKKKLMKENSKDYKNCLKEALDNAKERIELLDNSDKKCVQEEYKEWINDGLNKHTVLLLREDPII